VQLQQAVLDLPATIGENLELRDEIFTHLYRFEKRIAATWLRAAFQVKTSQPISAHIARICIQRGKEFDHKVSSRSDLEHHQREAQKQDCLHQQKCLSYRAYAITCPACLVEEDAATHQRYAKYQAEHEARLQELRMMPYREYLQTSEWQERRKRKLRRAGYRCQVCNKYNVRLNVHHRTYVRCGDENDQDLVVLCEVCHEIFHMHGSLAEEKGGDI
jgi:hypothetical protein